VTLIRQPISDQTWQGIRTEFTLPALRQVHRRLSELMEDPEPVMQQLVRVFTDDGSAREANYSRPGSRLDAPRVFLLRSKGSRRYESLWTSS
jgi:hypothetical protein